MIKKLLNISIFFIFLVLTVTFFAGFNKAGLSKAAHMRILQARYPQLKAELIESGLNAYSHAIETHIQPKSIITLVDYSKPSNEKRMWVIDLSTDRLLFEDYVSHGSASGDRYATRFSNKPGSHESSYGVFLTENPYVGSHGTSLRLKGLEKGFNDKAESRAIVVHSAWYASEDFAKKYGRLGRSWGCFAVSTKLIKPLIDTIKNGSLLVAYYPNKNWLNHSAFVG